MNYYLNEGAGCSRVKTYLSAKWIVFFEKRGLIEWLNAIVVYQCFIDSPMTKYDFPIAQI